MFKRLLTAKLIDSLEPNKVLVVYGPRRVGKTTILKQISEEYPLKMKFVDGEDLGVQEILSSKRLSVLKQFLGDINLLIVDEAQKISHIGVNLKLIADHIPNIKIIASGSASFALTDEVGESLTGRKKIFHLYPLSVRELIENYGRENIEGYMRNNLMIYGGYPETFSIADDKKPPYLAEITQSYLFRDILTFENVRNPKKLLDLLRLLAYQIGSEVSLSELGNQLDLHKDTVFRYLDLMEKSFIIFNVRGFSRNLRKEVTKSSKYYFYDNGIRNAVVNNFYPTGSLRNDLGPLWENFMAMERLKKQSYDNLLSNNYFWRTYDQQEIDWIEEREGKLFAFEFKWINQHKNKKYPRIFTQTYKNSQFSLITSENYLDFVG